MEWRNEWRRMAWVAAGFIACYLLPVGVPRFDNAVGEALASAGLPTVFTFEGGYAVDAVGTNAVNLLEGFNRSI